MTRWLALLATVVVFAALAAGAAAKAPGHRTGQSPEEVSRYWTDERMRDAKPRERARKGGGGGGVKAGVSVDAGSIPQHGKVFFTDGGGNYVCSGSALQSANQSVVWTAGHCVTSDAPGDGMVTNFLFVPAYRDGARPYGNWAATRLYTTPGWQESEEFGVDLGAAVVRRAGDSQTLNQAVGGLTPTFYLQPALQPYRVYGYPAAGKFNGQRLRLCDTAGSRTDASTTPDTVGVACDMTGGSSGGGWITSAGTVASVTSYGYANLKNVLFGPHQEADAQALYSTAQNATP